MFKFLKEKIKNTVSRLSRKVEEAKPEPEEKPTAEELVREAKKEVELEKKGFEEVPVEKEEIEEKVTERLEEIKEEAEQKVKEKVGKKEVPTADELAARKPKKGVLSKIKEMVVTKKISEKTFDELFWDMELVLLENNVAVEVIEKIKDDLKESLVDKPIPRGKTTSLILDSLKKSIGDLFDVGELDVVELAKSKKPFVICFVGINGSGKTTTIAKMVQLFKNKGMSCVMAAADTFRAAAIDQLQEHADKLKVRLIKHDYGADAAAVAFDAVRHAESKGIDVVLIDTAGRMHSNVNLMDEMKKIIRVAKPDLKIFVGESITGNDCTEQAKRFDETIGIDGVILSKADIDEKGGAAISVSYVTKKPILFLGTGQEYKDLQKFEPSIVMQGLEL
jgi:fused signal recognition particle receptor